MKNPYEAYISKEIALCGKKLNMFHDRRGNCYRALFGWGRHCYFSRIVRKKATFKRSERAEGTSW